MTRGWSPIGRRSPSQVGTNCMPIHTHIYEPLEASVIWEQFFTKITLASDGQRYFDGQAITSA